MLDAAVVGFRCNLTLRSGQKGRVSKGGHEHSAGCPSSRGVYSAVIETRRGVYPEVIRGAAILRMR
jgi:hypothetical protein